MMRTVMMVTWMKQEVVAMSPDVAEAHRGL